MCDHAASIANGEKMARTESYKKIERSAAQAFTFALQRMCQATANAVRTAARALDCRLTVMIVPHSQGKSISFETNAAALVLGAVLAAGVTSSCVYLAHGTAQTRIEAARLTERNRQTQASLDELRDANISLLEAAKRFQSSLSQSISALDAGEGPLAGNFSANHNGQAGGDLASLFNVKDKGSYSVQETQEIKALTDFLDNACAPVEQFGKMFDSRAVLFREIPSIWPVTNPNAHLSMAFGPNVHPITGQWYVHKGLDFSTYRSGDRVIATADGYVAMVGYDLSFGNYVIIKHKHGIYTRYAHMMYAAVKKGQYVNQKDLIGYVGNTGVTTGPHLHYEVHIGSDVVDPARYINVKLSK